jgi:acyl dehydratase
VDSSKVPLAAPSGVHHTYIDPDHVAAYALATNDENPLYRDGRAMPPVFAAVLAWDAFWGVPPIPEEALAGTIGGVHGEHDIRIHKPVEVGRWCHTVGEFQAVVCSSAGMNVYMRLSTTDDEGAELLEQYWSLLYRGTVTGGDRGTPPTDHSFPEGARLRPVGSARLTTTRDQTFRYAGASGDRNPMHLNDEAARTVGFPRKIHQGLCTLGIASRGLIELTAAGDPRRVRRIAVRFSVPVFPGDPIDLSVYDNTGSSDGSHSFAFEAASKSGTVLRNGLVEVADV